MLVAINSSCGHSVGPYQHGVADTRAISTRVKIASDESVRRLGYSLV